MTKKLPTLTIPVIPDERLSDLELKMLAIIAEQKKAPEFEQLEKLIKAVPRFKDITREEYKTASSHLFRKGYIVKGKQLGDTKNIRKGRKIIRQDNIIVGGEAWITTKGLATLAVPRIHEDFIMKGLLQTADADTQQVTYELTEPGQQSLRVDFRLHALAKHFGNHSAKALAGEEVHSNQEKPISPGI